MEKPEVVFVLGAPGSGKGTQCAKLQSFLACPFFSAGELLRDEVKSGSENGQLIQGLMKVGKIVPSEITVSLLEQAISKAGSKLSLVDGFPRNQQNYDVWMKIIGDKMAIRFVMLLECSHKEMQRRVLERGKASGRIDDNLEALQKRYITYEKETRPICDFFEQKGMLRVIEEGSVDEVSKRVTALFG